MLKIDNIKENMKESPTEGNKTPSIMTADKNKSQPQQKDLKEMTDKELASHYKSLFLKSKKLILHYEEELNQLKNNVSSLKQKLREYESGNETIFKSFIHILEEGTTCEVLFRFTYNDSSFFFFKNENRNV